MKKTTIDYYDGIHGPVLYIGAKNRKWLINMKNAVFKLRGGIISKIDFNQFSDVEISGCRTFNMIKATEEITPCVKCRDNMEILWVQDDKGLEYTLHLIDHLLVKNLMGHQLLDEDEIVIELSYKENSLDI